MNNDEYELILFLLRAEVNRCEVWFLNNNEPQFNNIFTKRRDVALATIDKVKAERQKNIELTRAAASVVINTTNMLTSFHARLTEAVNKASADAIIGEAVRVMGWEKRDE